VFRELLYGCRFGGLVGRRMVTFFSKEDIAGGEY
jgi:hypothetical protein